MSPQNAFTAQTGAPVNYSLVHDIYVDDSVSQLPHYFRFPFQ